MRLKSLLLATASFALMTLAAHAQTLFGQVSSAEEGTMEGVLVSAKKEGSTVTTTVVSKRNSVPASPASSTRSAIGRCLISARFKLCGYCC